jgi:cob(I)alamin adenosyltransferase
LYKSLFEVQNYLYYISSYIASQGNEKYLKGHTSLEAILEKDIDIMEDKLPVLKNFIHPGGSIESSHLHSARTIARRVERRYVTYSEVYNITTHTKFFNRLSDFLFVSARYMNYINNVDDVLVS